MENNKNVSSKVTVAIILAIIIFTEMYITFYPSISFFCDNHIVITIFLSILIPVFVICLFRKLNKQAQFNKKVLKIIIIILIIITMFKLCMLVNMFLKTNKTLKSLENLDKASYTATSIDELLDAIKITSKERKILETYIDNSKNGYDQNQDDQLQAELIGIDIKNNYYINLYDYSSKSTRFHRVFQLMNLMGIGSKYGFDQKSFKKMPQSVKDYDYSSSYKLCKTSTADVRVSFVTIIILSVIYEYLVCFVIIKFIKAKN